MLEIIDRQGEIAIPVEDLKHFVSAASKQISGLRGRNVEAVFVNDKEMRLLNENFRGISSTTDVLSFPSNAEKFEDANRLGEVIISTEQAVKQAEEGAMRIDLEIKQLLLHGILHLLGYDHESDEGEMNRLEITLRDKLDIIQ